MQLQQKLAGFSARKSSVVAIAVDPPARSHALAQRLGVTFPLLSDVERRVIRAYGVEDAENQIAWPAIFVVDASGTVRWRSLSETYSVRASADAILAALDALGRAPLRLHAR